MSEVKVNKITPTANCGTVTLGDSGDTFSIPSGVTLDVQGISSGVTAITWDTTAKTTAFTAVAGNGYFVNTTSGAITVTLPASPSAGDYVAIKDYANTADTNNITIGRNGEPIQGVANDFIINTEGTSVTLFYVDGTKGWMTVSDSVPSEVQTFEYVAATGGTITTCGDYKIHTFTGPGTFCVSSAGNSLGSNSVDYLVVAGGGGGGGTFGGGGGAGGYRESSGAASGCYTTSPLGACVAALPVAVQGYPITVGSGGTAGANPSGGGGTGSNSIFSTITSAGGGGGASASPCIGTDGGSGGGQGYNTTVTTAGSGNTPPVSPPQGNNGGTGHLPTPERSGAGGGGAGAVGNNRPGPGVGGAGVTSSINATPTQRAGGGGAGGNIYGGASPAAGGAGGGGAGAPGPSGAGTNGTVNTGGGAGGGGTNNGGVGGSGIVIIRYKFQN